MTAALKKRVAAADDPLMHTSPYQPTAAHTALVVAHRTSTHTALAAHARARASHARAQTHTTAATAICFTAAPLLHISFQFKASCIFSSSLIGICTVRSVGAGGRGAHLRSTSPDPREGGGWLTADRVALGHL